MKNFRFQLPKQFIGGYNKIKSLTFFTDKFVKTLEEKENQSQRDAPQSDDQDIAEKYSVISPRSID